MDFVTPLVQESKTQLVITFTNKGSVIIENPIATIEVDGLKLSETLDIEVPALKSVNYTLGTELLANSYNSTASICVSLNMNQNQMESDLNDNIKCIAINDESIIQAPFPNPTSSQSTISIVSSKSQEINVTLLNGTGESMTEFKLLIEAGLNTVNLDLETYVPGIYYAIIDMDEKTETFKIIVQQ